MVASLTRVLDDKGYLTLNQFVAYLKEFAPEAAISYPTALRLVREGKLLQVITRGHQHRISKNEIQRWIATGNLQRGMIYSSVSPEKQYWEE